MMTQRQKLVRRFYSTRSMPLLFSRRGNSSLGLWMVLLCLCYAFPSFAGHGISAANIEVVQNDLANTTNSVTVRATLSINDLRIRDGSNRGDYNVQAGPDASDDVASGVLMTCVAQNGRDNGETAYPGTNFCTSAMDYTIGEGAYFVPTFNAPTGTEYNVSVSVALFGYNQWLGGYARNSTNANGGVNDLFTGSPGLSLGTHFVELGGGVFTVDLRSLGIDSRTDGVLLVTGGENEDNYALSQANSTNGTWTVWVKDNGSNADAFEQDPVAFVFVPKTNSSVVCGKFQGDGTILIHSGLTPQFTITNTAAGNWRLQINGQSPETGVLIISPEGGTALSQDNIVSYEADDDGWVIQSRDLPPSTPSLQTPTGPVVSFAFIPSIATASLVAPDPNATGIGASAMLTVSVSNAAPGELAVAFYGREVPVAGPGPDFTMAVLPDTQYYTAERNGGTKAMLVAQVEYCITNRIARNIAYVTQLGDLVNDGDIYNGSPNLTQWRNATNGMYRLESQSRTQLPEGMPYGIAVGNHEMEPISTPSGTTIFYNTYFGIDRFLGRSYYGGHYGTNNNNHYDLFSASGLDFIVVYFEYNPSPQAELLTWANNVLRTNANRRAIIVTHNMGNTSTPVSVSSQWTAIYNALKTNANVFLMLGGHVTGQGSRVDTYNGRAIRTFVQDYQGWANGGNGFMRLYEFSPSNNVVTIQTFSPWTGEWLTDEYSELSFPYNMQVAGGSGSSGTPFSALGTNYGVTSGSLSSMQWTGLSSLKSYEWYVTVTDASGNSYSREAWQFITAPNYSPVANNQLFYIPGDTNSQVQLAASDLNGDQLTYQLMSLPQKGKILSFDTNTGVLNYMPARGYRGSDPCSFRATDGVSVSSTALVNLMVQNPTDTDYDGLPDWWETTYGVGNATADSDGDGHNNLAEYQAGTNPTNAASIFRIVSTVKTGLGYDLTWASVGGTRYRVQRNNGADGGVSGSFTDIVRSISLELDQSPYGTASTQTFNDISGGGAGATNRGFYRVRIVQ